MCFTAESLNASELVKMHAALVKSMAFRLKERLPQSIGVNDLIQDGMIGLLDAAKRFDPSAGYTFATFATPRIRGAMLEGIRGMDTLTRGQRAAVSALGKAIAEAEQELGRAPKDAELAQRLNLTVTECQELRSEMHRAQVIYMQDLSDGEDACGAAPDTLALVENRDARMRVAELIDQLPERFRNVLVLSYDSDLSVKEIARSLGVSSPRVCQMHNQAIEILRKKFHENSIAEGPALQYA